jgi:hypothetical protein
MAPSTPAPDRRSQGWAVFPPTAPRNAEIIALRHQITVLERQLNGQRIQLTPMDRALLAALLHRLPHTVLRQIRLLVRPETAQALARGPANLGPESPWTTEETSTSCPSRSRPG